MIIRPEDAQSPGAAPEALAASLARGINLQGWTLWYEPAFSLGEMQRLKADGFDHVRLYFDARLSDASPSSYPDEPARDWLIAKADQTIANALAAGLAVIVNPTPGIAPEDSAAAIDGHVSFLGAYAGHLAARFGTERIVVETTNEPPFPSQREWAAVEARLIASVREAAPAMTIMTAANVIGDGAWWQAGGLRDTEAHRTDNLLYSVHSYFPLVFTGQAFGAALWPGTKALAATAADATLRWYYNEGYGTKAALAGVIDEFARLADARGLALHVGEFGVVAHAPAASKLAYLAAATDAMERHGLGWSVWQTHGYHGLYTRSEAGLAPGDPALLAALGLSGARPDQKLTVTFSAGTFSAGPSHDLWAPASGKAFTPAPWTSTLLGPQQLGPAAGGPGASASIMRDPTGALTVIQHGAWRAERKLGIADDSHGSVTARGFAETWVTLGNGGRSTVTVETMHHRIITGDGADVVRVTGVAPGSVTLGGKGFISSGAGDDVIELGLRRAAANTGAVTATYEAWAGAGNDRIVIGDGIGGLFSGGSGDDVIVSGTGDEDLRGDVGIDTVELPGVRAAWRFAVGHDAGGRYVEAIGPGGNDRLRSVEWVVFGDGTVAKFGELVGDRAPTRLALTTADLGPGAVARATATDPEGGPLTWFLSDTAGKRFVIEPFSGEIGLRPGATMAAGARYELGIGVVDAAGNVTGATLAVGAAPPTSAVTLSNTMAADFSPLYAASWSGVPSGVRMLTAAELARLGPAADARVAVAEAAGTVSVSVLSAWNSVKNVRVEDGDGGTVRIDNAVHAGFLGTGSAASNLIVAGAKRADLATGSGSDTVTVEAFSNGGGAGNRIAVDAGAGNDRVIVTGHGSWTTGHLAGGAGNDVLVFAGGGKAVLDGGLGADTMQGGEGRDRFILRPGEVQGDRIEGFAGAGLPGGDWLVMEGFGPGAALTHQGNGLWRVSYTAAGEAMAGSFTIVGATSLGADDVIWA